MLFRIFEYIQIKLYFIALINIKIMKYVVLIMTIGLSEHEMHLIITQFYGVEIIIIICYSFLSAKTESNIWFVIEKLCNFRFCISNSSLYAYVTKNGTCI